MQAIRRKTSGSSASGIVEGHLVCLLVFALWRLMSIKCSSEGWDLCISALFGSGRFVPEKKSEGEPDTRTSMRQTLPQPILLLLFATPGGLQGTGTQKAAPSLDELCLGTQTLCSQCPGAAPSQGGLAQRQGESFCSECNCGRRKKKCTFKV